MNNYISVSQIKTFMKSKSKWAGHYLLGIKDEFKNDNFIIGTAYHKYLQESNDAGIAYLKSKEDELENVKQAYDDYYMCIENGKTINIPEGKWFETKFEKELFGVLFTGFVDGTTEDKTILEYKTTSKISSPDDKPAMYQAINSLEEYELQCWIYMKATGLIKAKLIEVCKQDTTIKRAGNMKKQEIIDVCSNFEPGDEKLTIQEIINKYNPKRPAAQILTFEMTPEFDKRMTDKFLPYIEEMKELYSKYRK